MTAVDVRIDHLAIARQYAATADRWPVAPRYDPASRWYHRLAVTDEYEVWLLTWLPGQGTELHDHGGSAGAFQVFAGTLTEDTVSYVASTEVTTGSGNAGSLVTAGSQSTGSLVAAGSQSTGSLVTAGSQSGRQLTAGLQAGAESQAGAGSLLTPGAQLTTRPRFTDRPRATDQPRVAGPPRITARDLGEGAGRRFGTRHIHRITNRSADPAISIHVYGPALTTMTRYRIGRDGLDVLTVEKAGVQW